MKLEKEMKKIRMSQFLNLSYDNILCMALSLAG